MHFEITEQTRETVLQWITKGKRKNGRLRPDIPLWATEKSGLIKALIEIE